MRSFPIPRRHVHVVYALALALLVAVALLVALTVGSHKRVPRPEWRGSGAPAAIAP